MGKTTVATTAWDKPPQLKNPPKGKTTVATMAWDKPPQLKSFPKATSANRKQTVLWTTKNIAGEDQQVSNITDMASVNHAC